MELLTLPQAPRHPCSNRRCGGLARRGERWCDGCQESAERARQRADAERRGSARERGYDVSWEKLRDQVLERDHYLCLYCRNVNLLSEAKLVDHILAKSAGGTDHPSNLASACRDCHDEKTYKHDGGWGNTPNPITRVEQFVPEWPELFRYQGRGNSQGSNQRTGVEARAQREDVHERSPTRQASPAGCVSTTPSPGGGVKFSGHSTGPRAELRTRVHSSESGGWGREPSSEAAARLLDRRKAPRVIDAWNVAQMLVRCEVPARAAWFAHPDVVVRGRVH